MAESKVPIWVGMAGFVADGNTFIERAVNGTFGGDQPRLSDVSSLVETLFRETR